MKNWIIILLVAGSGLYACQKDKSQPEQIVEDKIVQVESEVSNSKIDETNSHIIDKKQVGLFKLGEPVPNNLPKTLNIRRFYEDDIDDQGRSERHLHNVVFNHFEDQIELIMERTEREYFEDKLINEMIVYSNLYETRKGIKLGSTVGDIIREYQNVYAWYDAIHDYAYVEVGELMGVQFILNDKDYYFERKTDEHFEEIPLDYIDINAAIVLIKVH